MPRIRKKTSNRGTTRHRAKITKKAAESRKKSKRDTKKDPTWKSKKKKELGVPNSFAFKDQVLAELASEKRQSEEEKLAKKAAFKSAREVEEDEDVPGIQSLTSAKAITAPLTGSVKISIAQSIPEDDAPDLIDTQLATLQDVIDRADVILEVVDARDILGGRSRYIEGLIKDAGGKTVLVVNKIDLVPRETLEAWLKQLDIPTFLYKSPLPLPVASSSKTPLPTLSPTTVIGRAELVSALKTWAAEKSPPSEDFVVALMGLPMTGKTSIINSLLGGKKSLETAPLEPTVSSAKRPAPTTKAPAEIELEMGDRKVRIIDTPGWEFAIESDDEAGEEREGEDEAGDEQLAKLDALEDTVAGDLLRRNLGRVDRVKDVFPLVNWIFKRANVQDLMVHYNLPFFSEGDVNAFLTCLARANGRVNKFGEASLDGAARILIRDWALSSLHQYSTPPSGEAMEVDGQVDMTHVLSLCTPKREMRKTKAMIRLKASPVDEREVILDDDYTALSVASDEEGDGDEDEDDEEDDDEDEEDEVEEDDEGEDEEALLDLADGEELDLEDGPEPSSGSDLPSDEEDDEDPIPSPPRKGKRKAVSSPADGKSKKIKRVSFGPSLQSKEVKHTISSSILKTTTNAPVGKVGKRKRGE
ncbi:hypothetical protein M231_02404 [Tremella mesenterica]|uniref:Nuclear GTP-binding protein n=1 Tax=Tremella mesenterica TaxID=5217 RepID=A0A4Q1BQX2_TREME|nr:hypothetical protein M231_02404 [Tremella mesenterica]